MVQGKPHPRLLTIWRTRLVLCMAVAAAAINAFGVRGYSVWLVQALLLFYLYALLLPGRYRNIHYRIKGKHLLIDCGWLFARIKAIPLGHVQYIERRHTPLSYMFGLYTLTIYSAGSISHIPGLSITQVDRLERSLLSLNREEGVPHG